MLSHTNTVFDLAISLGYNCRPAFQLKKIGLRKQSFPFDWNVAYLDSITQAINEDFKNIYDCHFTTDGNSYLQNSVYPYWIFVHIDINNTESRKVYDRRITRLEKVLNSNHNVLFVAWDFIINEKIINNFIETVGKKYPKLKFKLLFVQEIFSDVNVVEFVSETDHLVFYKIYSTVDMYSVHTTVFDGHDNYKNLFNQFKFDIKLIPDDIPSNTLTNKSEKNEYLD